MSGLPYQADAERVAASNAWAFVRWCAAEGRFDAGNLHLAHLRGAARWPIPPSGGAGALWPALIAWSARDPAAFGAAVLAFAGVEDHTLIRPAAEVLLHADLRPDDRVLLAGVPASPWEFSARYRTTLLTSGPSPDPFARAAAERATVLIADLDQLLKTTPPPLPWLRILIAVGGPLPPTERSRLHAGMKAGGVVLARAGDMLWGNPLDPARGEAGPALRFFHWP